MPNAFECRTVIPRGGMVSDEICLPAEVRRHAAWNVKNADSDGDPIWLHQHQGY